MALLGSMGCGVDKAKPTNVSPGEHKVYETRKMAIGIPMMITTNTSEAADCPVGEVHLNYRGQ